MPISQQNIEHGPKHRTYVAEEWQKTNITMTCVLTKSYSTIPGVWIIITGGHGSRGRLWQPVQNMILHYEYTNNRCDLQSQEGKNLNLASVSFLSISFLRRLEKTVKFELPAFSKTDGLSKSLTMKPQHLIWPQRLHRIHWKVIANLSVFFVVNFWTKNKNLYLFWNAKNVDRRASDSNCVLVHAHSTTKPNWEGQEVNTQHSDASDQNTSPILVFFF